MMTGNNPVIKIKQSLTLVPDAAEKISVDTCCQRQAVSARERPQSVHLYAYRLAIVY